MGDAMEMIKIGMIGIIGVFLAVSFRSVKTEYAVYIGIVTGFVIFYFTVQNLIVFVEELKSLWNYMEQESGFFAILLKVSGIAYICEFSTGICKDAGYGAVAGQIELFGKVLVILTGLPVLLSVIQTIQNFAR